MKEIVSIMGDEAYTPIVAARIMELFNFFVEIGEINLPIAINNDAYFLMQINELQKQVVSTHVDNLSLNKEISELKEERELDRQVDYIIRESQSFENASSQLVADKDGWCLALSPEPSFLECYLFLLMPNLPGSLKERLLQRIKREGNPTFYVTMLKNFPRRQTIAERLMEIDNQNTFEAYDEFGKKVELIYKPEYHPEYAGKSISFEELKRLVINAKEHASDDVYMIKTFLDIKYPEKLKLPYRGGKSKD